MDENGGKTGRTGRNGGRADENGGRAASYNSPNTTKRHRDGESRSGEAQRGEESSSGEARKPRLGGGSSPLRTKKGTHALPMMAKRVGAMGLGRCPFCFGAGPENFMPVPLLFRGGAGAFLSEWVLGRIWQRLRLVVGNVLDAEVAEGLEERLSYVVEGYCAVVRIVLLEEHVAVESSHLRDSEEADAAEGAGRYVEDVALGDV